MLQFAFFACAAPTLAPKLAWSSVRLTAADHVFHQPGRQCKIVRHGACGERMHTRGNNNKKQQLPTDALSQKWLRLTRVHSPTKNGKQLQSTVSVLSLERAYRTPDPELIIFDYFLWFPLYSFATSKIKIYRTAGTLPEARYILLLRLYRIMHAVATIIRFVVRGLFLFYIFPSKS